MSYATVAGLRPSGLLTFEGQEKRSVVSSKFFEMWIAADRIA